MHDSERRKQNIIFLNIKSFKKKIKNLFEQEKLKYILIKLNGNIFL